MGGFFLTWNYIIGQSDKKKRFYRQFRKGKKEKSNECENKSQYNRCNHINRLLWQQQQNLRTFAEKDIKSWVNKWNHWHAVILRIRKKNRLIPLRQCIEWIRMFGENEIYTSSLYARYRTIGLHASPRSTACFLLLLFCPYSFFHHHSTPHSRLLAEYTNKNLSDTLQFVHFFSSTLATFPFYCWVFSSCRQVCWYLFIGWATVRCFWWRLSFNSSILSHRLFYVFRFTRN